MKRLTKKAFRGFFALLALTVLLCGFDSQEQKVYDDAGLLSEEERGELQEMLVAAAYDTKQDLVIVTTADSGGKSAREYADDFYDEHGFGYDPLFYSKDIGKSFGKATLEEKTSCSHRGRAALLFAEKLKEIYGE